MSEQLRHLETFRALHRPGQPLVLVNAWDAASARIAVAAGAPAVATTSAGVSWSWGAPDGDGLDRAAALAAAARVVAAVRVPVTVDFESGYGATPDEVAAAVAEVVALGAVGVNIEDGARSIDDQRARLAALRGLDVFVNARIDTFLRGTGDLAETLRRAAAFVEAGADAIFVPGVGAPDTIAALVKEVPVPLNVLVGAGSPSVAELADLGVARVSLGSSVAQAAYALAARAAEEAYGAGTYTAVADAYDYGSLNALMTG